MFTSRSEPRSPIRIYGAEPHMRPDVMRVAAEEGRWPCEARHHDAMPLSMSGAAAFVGIELAGYAYYERLGHGRWRLEAVVVSRGHRRSGVGRALVAWVAKRAIESGVATLSLAVDERDLPAHLFLRACGFTATGVIKGRPRPGLEPIDRYRFRMDFAPTAVDEAACMGVWP